MNLLEDQEHLDGTPPPPPPPLPHPGGPVLPGSSTESLTASGASGNLFLLEHEIYTQFKQPEFTPPPHMPLKKAFSGPTHMEYESYFYAVNESRPR